MSLTATGSDVAFVGGSASKLAASYSIANGVTLKASVQDENGKADDDKTIGLSYAMGDITVGCTSIRQSSAGSSDDEWDFSVAYAAGAVGASFAADGADASALAAMHDKAGTVNDLKAICLNFAF